MLWALVCTVAGLNDTFEQTLRIIVEDLIKTHEQHPQRAEAVLQKWRMNL
jgi:hypothetical protein